LGQGPRESDGGRIPRWLAKTGLQATKKSLQKCAIRGCSFEAHKKRRTIVASQGCGGGEKGSRKTVMDVTALDDVYSLKHTQ